MLVRKVLFIRFDQVLFTGKAFGDFALFQIFLRIHYSVLMGWFEPIRGSRALDRFYKVTLNSFENNFFALIVQSAKALCPRQSLGVAQIDDQKMDLLRAPDLIKLQLMHALFVER